MRLRGCEVARLLVVCCGLSVASAFAAQVPVTPGTLVEVSYAAAVVKGPVIEDDPSLAELLPVSMGRPGKTGAKFAAAEWNFLDVGGKRLRHTRISTERTTLFSRNPRSFSFRAYVPEKATAVEVVPAVLTEGDEISIEKLTARVVKPGEVLNQNPDFTADSASLPGWQLTGAARFGTDQDGVPCAILEDGGVFGDVFPVTGGKTLVVTLKAAPPRFATKKHIPWGAIHFYDTYAQSTGKEQPFARPKLNVHSNTLAEKTETYPIPASAKWCRIAVRIGTIYGCQAKEMEK